jgi:hypothetical protein
MKQLSPAHVIFLLALLPAPLFAKAAITRVAIEGNQLTVNITDRSTLAQFNIWSGPGTGANGSSSSQPQSFVVDWSKGPQVKAPQGLPDYQVSFYGVLPGQKSESLLYVVTYAFDPHTGRGYVYLPGKGDRWYGLDIGTILRGVEGKWFHAWNAWDSIAGPLIAEKTAALEGLKNGPTCFAIRRYLAKRVAAGSDSTYIAGSTNCIASSDVEVVSQPGRLQPSKIAH